MRKINMVDIMTPIQRYKKEYMELIESVIDSGAFVGGQTNPYIVELENNLVWQLNSYTGGTPVAACVCNSGTAALLVALMVLGVKPGDSVILPDFNFIAGAEAVSLLGAKPLFVDVDLHTYMLNIDEAIRVTYENSSVKAVIVTDMFGQYLDYSDLCKKLPKGVSVIEDGAQSFGAWDSVKRTTACCMGDIATTSFYPAKPLGAFGEGGAIFSKNKEYIERARMILNHGSNQKYVHSIVGINGRLNAIQAASVDFKLKHYFFKEIIERRRIANHYYDRLPLKILPKKIITHPSWAQFTIRVDNREAFRSHMQACEIATDIHYPYCNADHLPYYSKTKSNARSLTESVVSIPIHPYMTRDDVDYVCDTILKFIK